MEITTQEFKEKLKRGDKFLVDFYGQWCGPCKAMKPMYESASKLLTESKSATELYTFDIDKDKEFVINEIGIRSVPTIKGYSGGGEVYHSSGVLRTEQIMEVAKKI
jgi:thioredoxin 1